MMRKNHFPSQQYHKLVRLTEYGEELKSQKSVSDQHSDYRSYDLEDLVEKIKDQENQIQKLLSIIDKYKSKIEQFEQYEEVIKEFLARKQLQKSMSQVKNQAKHFDQSTVIQNSKISIEPSKRPNKQLIVPSYSITIFCENQKFQYESQRIQYERSESQRLLFEKYSNENSRNNISRFERGESLNLSYEREGQRYEKIPSIKLGTPNKTATFSIDSNQRDEDKENKAYLTNYKDKSGKEQNRSGREQYYKGSKSFAKSNSTFDINMTIPVLNNSEYLEEMNRRSLMQRVPSVTNMRRIQKCFKLLKS